MTYEQYQVVCLVTDDGSHHYYLGRATLMEGMKIIDTKVFPTKDLPKDCSFGPMEESESDPQ